MPCSLRNLILRAMLLFALILGLAACNGSGNSSGLANSAPGNVVFSGSVGDGPVTGATVTVYSSTGAVLGTIVSDSNAQYQARVTVVDQDYPLRLEVSGGIDLVTGNAPDFKMVSVMVHPIVTTANINPFSTLIVKAAESLPGGLNIGNISTARNYVMGKLGFGLNGVSVPDPITTVVTDNNVAEIVKASEALGELVRRTRDLIRATGRNIDGDRVVRALAADLTDGHLDGQGSNGTDATVSAVANVVTGQVLVEALSNNLKVGGVIATGVVDQSIISTHAGVAGSQLTGNVRITQGMLDQLQAALGAVQVLDNSPAVANIDTTVAGLSANVLPSSIAGVLPVSSANLLDYAVSLVPSATPADIEAINQAASSGGGGSGPVNTAPMIGGNPGGTVTAGNAYSFQPTASDADGDNLTFSIANKPTWASFNSGTGRLNGTPSDAQAGTYSNIVISVTDGTATVSLPGFSIQVNSILGSFSLGWVAPTVRADGSALSLADIDRYRVYYGTSPGNYPNSFDIMNGSATSAVINNVPSGTYRVVMSTIDTNGVESAKSAEVTKNVQ